MKRLMELLGLDIPKWEGPTVCESSTSTSESSTDVKPAHGDAAKEKVKKEIKEERKREATQKEAVKEEAVSVKRERAGSPVGIKDNK